LGNLPGHLVNNFCDQRRRHRVGRFLQTRDTARLHGNHLGHDFGGNLADCLFRKLRQTGVGRRRRRLAAELHVDLVVATYAELAVPCHEVPPAHPDDDAILAALRFGL
jgi:hypothetical protein